MKFIVPVLLLLLLIGCTDEQKTKPKSSDSGEVVVSVDSRSLTKGQLADRAEMMLKFRSLQNTGMKVADLNKMKSDLIATYPDFFIEHALWANYAEANKIKVDKSVLRRVQTRAALSASRGKNRKYKVLRSKFGKLANVLDDHVRMMAVTASAKRHLCKLNPTNIPPDFASNAVKRIAEYNARMTVTNAAIYAQATNCWQALKAGADFVDMVQKYSTVPQEIKDNGEWGTLELRQLEPDKKLYDFVSANAAGAISPPIEGDNGLMIVRIDKIKGTDCTLSRVYFSLPMFHVVMTEEQVIKQMRDKHNAKLVEKQFKLLKKKAKIVKAGDKPRAKAKKAKAKKARKSSVSQTNAVNQAGSKITQTTVKEGNKK